MRFPPFRGVGRMVGALAVIFVFTGWTARAADEMRWDLAEHGAIGDGKTLNTKIIQDGIDQCAQASGGTVVVPKGEFLSGSIFLKQKVRLELQEGGVLKGSTNIEDYPKINTRIEGHFEPWRAALVNAEKMDVAIEGPGTLDGNGAPFWAEFWRCRKENPKTTNLDVERPRLVFIRDCPSALIDHVLFKDSGFWNLHLYNSQDITVISCRFQAPSGPQPNHAPSSDGIDVDSCQKVVIYGCSFSVGDDCIALKGSKGPFAMEDKDSPPVENISIDYCTFEAGGAVVTCGSEATTVRNVSVSNCKVQGRVPVLRLKLRPDTPQLYENISCTDITGEGTGTIFEVAPWKQFFDLKGQPPPNRAVRNVTISDVHGTFGSLGGIIGNPGDDVSGITLRNVDVKMSAERPLRAPGVKDLRFENVKINGVEVSAPAAEPAPVASPASSPFAAPLPLPSVASSPSPSAAP